MDVRRRQEKYLLFGKNGWIGGKLIKLLQVRTPSFHSQRGQFQ